MQNKLSFKNHATSFYESFQRIIVLQIQKVLKTKLFTLTTPGSFMGTMIRDLLRWAFPSLVLASRHIQSAWREFVIHIWKFKEIQFYIRKNKRNQISGNKKISLRKTQKKIMYTIYFLI